MREIDPLQERLEVVLFEHARIRAYCDRREVHLGQALAQPLRAAWSEHLGGEAGLSPFDRLASRQRRDLHIADADRAQAVERDPRIEAQEARGGRGDEIRHVSSSVTDERVRVA